MAPVLTVDDLKVRLGNFVVLRGVSLMVDRGEIVVIRGPNGAGKSTLCEAITGAIDAEGEVRIGGASIRSRQARGQVGYAPSAASMPEHLTVHEWIEVCAALRGLGRRRSEQVSTALQTFGLEETVGMRLGLLSLGQRKRVVLAAASLGTPTLLVLDEPTVGLDSDGLETLTRWVRDHCDRGGAALVASHDEWLGTALSARSVWLEAGVVRAAA